MLGKLAYFCLAMLVILGLELRASEARVSPALRLESIGFGGEGQIPLAAVSESAGEGSLRCPGARPVENPVWVAGQRSAPVSYVQGSRPQLAVTLRMDGSLPTGTPIELVGLDRDRGRAVATSVGVALASGTPHESLDFLVELESPRLEAVACRMLRLEWRVRIGNERGGPVGVSETEVYVTYDHPRGEALAPGGGVSVPRLKLLTALAAGESNPHEILARLGPVLTAPTLYNLRRGLHSPEIDGEPFAVLEGVQADCRTLSTLLERALGLLGIPDARVMYVYPRAGSWSGLSSPDPSGSQDLEYPFDLYGTRDVGSLYYDDNGPNRYQACCVWSGIEPATGKRVNQWWMGGKGTFRLSDYDVLMAVSYPNRRGAARQYLVDALSDDRGVVEDGPIPFPDLPRVWGFSAEQAEASLREAGYHRVVVLRRQTSLPWLAGRARRCFAPDHRSTMPVPPSAQVVLEVYGT